MKTKFFRPANSVSRLLACLVLSAAAVAAPLKEPTAVHARPDRASPAIAVLAAGTEPTAAASAPGTTPAGWLAIELRGPFEGYVENKDLTKSLDIRPGSLIRLAPKTDAGVLATAEKGDQSSITGLRGRWNQISLEKTLVGYINVSGVPSQRAPVATAAAAATPPTVPPPTVNPAPAQPGPMATAPVTPGVYGVAAAGQAAPMVSLSDANSLPRQFAGTFVSTRRPFTPRRPYDYALNDNAGKRYAYVDVSKLLLTEQIEKYIGHSVVVFGTAKAVPNTKDMVILVESLQLK